MGRKALDLVGNFYTNLLVLKRVVGKDVKNSYWLCRCVCGKGVVVSGINLKSGNTKSCGCITYTLGGKSKTPEFLVWQSMVQRCYNDKHKRYSKYGARGIKVCQKWKDSFLNFIDDMGKCPKGLSLDRIDNDGDYTPENCAWRTIEEQNNNRGSYNRVIEFNGDSGTISQMARRYGIRVSTLFQRIDRLGWSVKKALTTPVR
jgi:hypothetical protein